MPLDLTYCEIADRILKVRKSTNTRTKAQRIILATVLALLIASALGVFVSPYPIHGYIPVI